jgi:uncharacterized membrane protein YhaH (DUF805 family)
MRSVGFDDFVTFFFRPQGRIARREYALGAGLLLAINAAVIALLLTRKDLATLAALVLISLWLPTLAAQLVLAAKRCHDLGISGVFCLPLLIPAVGVFWLIALVFAEGNAGPNAYGPPPAFRPD